MIAIQPCPFCGASASIEEMPSGVTEGVLFSVGCDSEHEAECMGYQSLTAFNTRGEAITAWNRRTHLDSAGPPGSDRRWKVGAEQALGCTFNTPREMMDALVQLKGAR